MHHARFDVTVAADRYFAEILDRHRGPLLAYARRLTGSSVDADDFVQDAALLVDSTQVRAG